MRLSWQARLLTPTLRLIEKPQLAYSKNLQRLRRNFERKAGVLFHAPKGVARHSHHLGLEVKPTSAHGSRAILYFHGGGYFFGSPNTHAAMMADLARRTGLRVILAQYPLAPEHPFPSATDATYAAWHALLEKGVASNDILLGGDSAGGGLALSLLGRLLAESAELPAGVFAISPWCDLTCSGDSIESNSRSEAILPAHRFPEIVKNYLRDVSPSNPLASPLFAAFEGAPPVWLCADRTEILLDDTLRLEAKLLAANIETESRMTSGLPHVWPIFHNILPEARQTLDHLSDWITRRWPS